MELDLKTTNLFSAIVVPMPVIREPTDYIPNSADTSQNASREVTQTIIGHEELSAKSDKQRRPKVVSVFCRQHEGQRASAPYSIKPEQMVNCCFFNYTVLELVHPIIF